MFLMFSFYIITVYTQTANVTIIDISVSILSRIQLYIFLLHRLIVTTCSWVLCYNVNYWLEGGTNFQKCRRHLEIKGATQVA